jgi:uncharacterized protein YeaC (DUF1315 family)
MLVGDNSDICSSLESFLMAIEICSWPWGNLLSQQNKPSSWTAILYFLIQSMYLQKLMHVSVHSPQTPFDTFADLEFAETFAMKGDPMQPCTIHCILATTWLPFSSFLQQKLLHLMGQSSTTCTLVANLIVYLESHLLCALIVAIEWVLELTRSY